MNKKLLMLAAAAAFPICAIAQNVAVVNGKPVPKSRMDTLMQQASRSGQPVTPELEARVREEVVLREIFAQEAERRGIAASGARAPSPMDQLRQVVQAVQIPVQAVGGLSLEQAIECPRHGAPLVVLGAPLTIDADAFRTADGNLEASLRLICDAVHAQTVLR